MIAKKYIVIATLVIAVLSVTAFSLPLSTMQATPAGNSAAPYAAQGHADYNYVQATYGQQWTYQRVTTPVFVSVHDGSAMKWSFVYQINNVGSSPLYKAILVVHMNKVEVGGTWYTDATHLGMVHLVNANGVMTGTSNAYQELGTIAPGSFSQHVLNMEYSSGVQQFVFHISVWYVPAE